MHECDAEVGAVIAAWDQWTHYIADAGLPLHGCAPFAEAMERLRAARRPSERADEQHHYRENE